MAEYSGLCGQSRKFSDAILLADEQATERVPARSYGGLIAAEFGECMKAVFLYWRLAIFRISGKALMALALSIATTLNGTEWASFTSTQKFVSIVTALGAMWLVIDAFLDQTLNQIQQNPDGLGIPGAESRTTQVTQTVKTEVATVPAAVAVSPP